MGMIEVERRPDGVAVVVLDHPDKPVNTLSPAVVEEFNEKVAPLLDEDDVRAMVVVSAKADTFIAGADLELIEGLGEEEISNMSRQGNALLERIFTSKKPVVAAVHGAALGGGLEVALACHYILATDDPRTVLAQSEVMLGLLPAGGGTQRLVERVGLVAALPMLLTGKRVRARRAKKMGLVDAITTPGGIAETGARSCCARRANRWHGRPGASTRRLRRSSSVLKRASKRAVWRGWRARATTSGSWRSVPRVATWSVSSTP